LSSRSDREYDAAMRHFPLREIGYAIGFVVLMAALYVGAYYGMVTKEQFGRGRNFVVDYRIGGEWAESFFAPMHQIDREIRPATWINEMQRQGEIEIL
jgi:hypothetical protein